MKTTEIEQLFFFPQLNDQSVRFYLKIFFNFKQVVRSDLFSNSFCSLKKKIPKFKNGRETFTRDAELAALNRISIIGSPAACNWPREILMQITTILAKANELKKKRKCIKIKTGP